MTPHSLADKKGIRPGDVILKVCGTLVRDLTNEMAKMEILRAGNELDLVIERWVVGSFLCFQCASSFSASLFLFCVHTVTCNWEVSSCCEFDLHGYSITVSLYLSCTYLSVCHTHTYLHTRVRTHIHSIDTYSAFWKRKKCFLDSLFVVVEWIYFCVVTGFTVVPAWLQFRRIPVLFYQVVQVSI